MNFDLKIFLTLSNETFEFLDDFNLKNKLEIRETSDSSGTGYIVFINEKYLRGTGEFKEELKKAIEILREING